MKKIRRKRRLRKSIRQGLMIFFSIGILMAIVYVWKESPFLGVKSQNSSTSKYRDKNCLVFYPKNSQKGREIAAKMCEGVEEKTVMDYQLQAKGKSYLVSYEKASYLVNEHLEDIVYQQANDQSKVILRDYLIDAMRIQERPEATTPAFYENIDTTFELLTLQGEDLLLRFLAYGLETKIPAKYLAEKIGLSLGIPTDNHYQPPLTISPNKPLICLTYDDGPNTSSTVSILDTLEKYGAKATFYVVGTRLSDAALEVAKRGISRGHEYGSHTHSHPDLTRLSLADIRREVFSPVNVFKELLHYDMKTLRPPYGAVNQDVKSLGLEVVLWTIDTEDWRNRNTNTIFESVRNAKDGDIVLFHDVFDESAEATKKIVPYLLEKGFQFVTIDQYRQWRKGR